MLVEKLKWLSIVRNEAVSKNCRFLTFILPYKIAQIISKIFDVKRTCIVFEKCTQYIMPIIVTLTKDAGAINIQKLKKINSESLLCVTPFIFL